MFPVRKTYTKIALTLSIFLLILWAVLGTGTSLAWFTDTTPVAKNTFLVGDLDLTVSLRDQDGNYTPIDEDTNVFGDSALYEPGYVQRVILEVKNDGDVPFEYRFSVDVNSVTVVSGVLGNDIYLPDYLRYGVIFADTDRELLNGFDRPDGVDASQESFPNQGQNYPLNTYSQADSVTLQPGDCRYIALIVRMPEEIGNLANHRGDKAPDVTLGITVFATQEGTM